MCIRDRAISHDLHLWMSSNRLSLNSSKTQLIWFGTPQQLQKLDFLLLAENFPQFSFSTSVRDFGFTLDSSLTLNISVSLHAPPTFNSGASGLFADLSPY